ncbi:LysR family transcriptional regulator [Parvibium lacunae]|uniref:LysR family transcriptional regulator n=1 Tax=Parvibium lacunae TaxID=1888893 RepID=A0A368L365_9BURK|nr:LysR family transcriptional regulator [Parvibium lacunae]RCS58036.1 LysR family transcriptional regulator [Parvibium lacunae]
MDKFKQLETFVAVATKGGLSAAAKLENVAPAIIGRRIDALEARLGIKLLIRTTRRVTLTQEGQAFLENCERILQDLDTAENAVALGSVQAGGQIKLSAPGGFGRQHVAPLLPTFTHRHPAVQLHLDLSDRYVDLINESIDLAIRIGQLPDSNLISVKLADNPRVIVASPSYLSQHGTPQTPQDLTQHRCLTLGQESAQHRGWLLKSSPHDPRQLGYIKVRGDLACNDGSALLDWAIKGYGLAWRSMWEVRGALSRGQLVTVLNEYAAPPVGIYAVFPDKRLLPLRVRLLIDFFKQTYGDTEYWLTGKVTQ